MSEEINDPANRRPMPRRRRPMTPQEVQDRLDTFAVLAAKVVSASEHRFAVLHYYNQIVRSSSAPSAFYAEARAAATPRQYRNKLHACLQELYESSSWLNKLSKFTGDPLRAELKECDELCAIVFSSIRTSRQGGKASRPKALPVSDEEHENS